MIYKDGKKVMGLYRDGKAITKAFRDGKLVWQKDGADVKYVKRITAEMPSPRSPEFYYMLGLQSFVGDTTTTGYADITIKGTSFRARGSGKKEGAKFAYARTPAATLYVYVDVPENMKLSTKDLAIGDTFYADIKTPGIVMTIPASQVPSTIGDFTAVSFNGPTVFYPKSIVKVDIAISGLEANRLDVYLYSSMALALTESKMPIKKSMGRKAPGSHTLTWYFTKAEWQSLMANVTTWGTVQPSFGVKLEPYIEVGDSKVLIKNVTITNDPIKTTMSFKVKSIETY
jgi:hypothetical protein